MFTKILIANRGEIACRVASTARRMGIRSVAVYSVADAGARHVALCDEAVPIGPSEASASYLRGDHIIAAALSTGAQAVHPGYGFLSENAAFADACADAGLVFIGPPAAAIRAMGSKSAAKTLMASAGVPLVPGYHGARQEAEFLQGEADRIGYPVLLKASAGGGGKGMRVVERSADFGAALASCQREAISAFGDDQVLVEKYLARPRHIELQIFADRHGNCIHLFERDCSVQRRHQKVLEEAPAPGMPAERRAAMGAAAVAAARAVNYVGAGTVEFIANQDGSFYFMEMNTRLQVEHPVTEMITGTDLVEWQLRVAAGQPLPRTQQQLAIHGHAIEARIYAENPDKGFLPAIGTLRHLVLPPAVQFETGASAPHGLPAPVRIDAGVRAGDSVTPFYDPMLAKLVAWGADRNEALARMSQALAACQVVGLATNVAFLRRLVDSAPFTSADLDTGLIERHRDVLFPARLPVPAAALALAVVALLATERRPGGDPWDDPRGWRLNGSLTRTLTFADDDTSIHTTLVYQPDGWLLDQTALTQTAGEGGAFSLLLGGQVVRGSVYHDGPLFHVFTGGQHYTLRHDDPLARTGAAELAGGRLTAPMPGKVVAVLIVRGQRVRQGEPLLIMEAMKMEHTIAAPHDGTVEDILYAVGDQVADGAPLLAYATV